MPLNVLKRSLSFRIAFYFAASFTLALTLAFGITYFTASSHLEDSSREMILTKWKEFSTILQSEGLPGLKVILSDKTESQKNAAYFIRVTDDLGKNLVVKDAHSEKRFDFAHLLKTYDLKNHWQTLQAIDDEDHFEIYGEHVNGFLLEVGKSNEDREQVLEDLAYMFIISGLVLNLAGAAIGVWIAKHSLLPLGALTEAIRKVESGDFSSRVSVNTTDLEIQELSQAFNRMTERIQRLIAAMKECLDNVAHDIRTPLTRIRNSLESIILSNRNEPDALERCIESVADVTSLVGQLLDISEAESGALQLKVESVNLSQVIHEIIELYQFVAEEAGVELKPFCDPTLNWPMDRQRVKRALANLIDNALKFAPSGTAIRIEATQNSDSLRIQVDDLGPGITEDDLPKIWDRLYRGDKSRSKKGMGLGLSLVQAIVRAHNGQVGVTVDNGSHFYMTYPKQT